MLGASSSGGGSYSDFLLLCGFFNSLIDSYSAVLNIFLFFELQWYGICLSDVGDFEGIKTKIGNAIIIKEHFEVMQRNFLPTAELMCAIRRLFDSCEMVFATDLQVYFCSTFLVPLCFSG